MICSVCGSSDKIENCGGNGRCIRGGSNKMNTFDWMSMLGIDDPDPCDIVEISFKNGSTKEFYRKPPYLNVENGEIVVVNTGSGFDVGEVTLKGELVRFQLRKKYVKAENVFRQIIRKADKQDLIRLEEARKLEHRIMVRARAIARTLSLDMKISDVQYQGDLKKATFFYIADNRVDFRELVRTYAQEFKVRIEMKQIGARQEAGMIGGIGTDGRELDCAAWMSNFKTVATSAARYQNLSINQTKLTGHCGRLKCNLNYELDMYIEALQKFPQDAKQLHVKMGSATLIKVDIFKEIMFYNYEPKKGRSMVVGLTLDRVKYLSKLNKDNKKADELLSGEKVHN